MKRAYLFYRFFRFLSVITKCNHGNGFSVSFTEYNEVILCFEICSHCCIAFAFLHDVVNVVCTLDDVYTIRILV